MADHPRQEAPPGPPLTYFERIRKDVGRIRTLEGRRTAACQIIASELGAHNAAGALNVELIPGVTALHWLSAEPALTVAAVLTILGASSPGGLTFPDGLAVAADVLP